METLDIETKVLFIQEGGNASQYDRKRKRRKKNMQQEIMGKIAKEKQ